MNEDIRKALHYILRSVGRIEQWFTSHPSSHSDFSVNLDSQDIVLWNLVVIGEAANRIRTRDPAFPLANMNAIIGTRNHIVHAYDKVDLDILWSLVTVHLPQLKVDVEKILNEQTDEQ